MILLHSSYLYIYGNWNMLPSVYCQKKLLELQSPASENQIVSDLVGGCQI